MQTTYINKYKHYSNPTSLTITEQFKVQLKRLCELEASTQIELIIEDIIWNRAKVI